MDFDLTFPTREVVESGYWAPFYFEDYYIQDGVKKKGPLIKIYLGDHDHADPFYEPHLKETIACVFALGEDNQKWFQSETMIFCVGYGSKLFSGSGLGMFVSRRYDGNIYATSGGLEGGRHKMTFCLQGQGHHGGNPALWKPAWYVNGVEVGGYLKPYDVSKHVWSSNNRNLKLWPSDRAASGGPGMSSERGTDMDYISFLTDIGIKFHSFSIRDMWTHFDPQEGLYNLLRLRQTPSEELAEADACGGDGEWLEENAEGVPVPQQFRFELRHEIGSGGALIFEKVGSASVPAALSGPGIISGVPGSREMHKNPAPPGGSLSMKETLVEWQRDSRCNALHPHLLEGLETRGPLHGDGEMKTEVLELTLLASACTFEFGAYPTSTTTSSTTSTMTTTTTTSSTSTRTFFEQRRNSSWSASIF